MEDQESGPLDGSGEDYLFFVKEMAMKLLEEQITFLLFSEGNGEAKKAGAVQQFKSRRNINSQKWGGGGKCLRQSVSDTNSIFFFGWKTGNAIRGEF